MALRDGSPELIAQAALGVAGVPGGDADLDPATRAVLEEALAVLPDTDSALRARVLTLLGHFGWEPVAGEQSEDDGGRLRRAGIDMARRVADPHALADVLWQWHLWSSHGRETLPERLAVADELVELANARGDKEGVVLARQWRIADRFEAGDLPGARTELAVATREADELRLPFLQWNVTYAQATLALTEGRLAEVERLAH
ncbi:MAG: hypothetical protein ACRD12_21180 [Acidimicrobiales bacterium]